MEKDKSTVSNKNSFIGVDVNLPEDRKKVKSLKQYKEEKLGKLGTEKRDSYEAELKMEIIQDMIREIRKKRHLSQEELGDLVGVKKSQISKLEKGYENATVSTLSKVFKALNAKIKISVELEDEKLELV